jgi:hypothetical protein
MKQAHRTAVGTPRPTLERESNRARYRTR